MTVSDIAVSIVIAAVIAAAIWKILRDRKKGVVCTGCSGCPAAGSCNRSPEKK